jgi:hypothetical protein
MSPADTDDTWLALFERLVALSGERVVLRVPATSRGPTFQTVACDRPDKAVGLTDRRVAIGCPCGCECFRLGAASRQKQQRGSMRGSWLL